MAKFFLFLEKRDGIARGDFIDHVERAFLPELARKAGVGVVCRNVLIPGATVTADHIVDVPMPPAFDIVIEGRLAGAADLARLKQDVDGLVAASGSMFDPAKVKLLQVEAQSTPDADLPASAGAPTDGSMVKMMIKIQRRSGMTLAAFRDYYEGTHAPLAARHLKMIAGYQRNYVVDEQPSSTRGEGSGPRPADEADAVVEFWFRDEPGFKAMNAAFTDPKLGPMFAEDEERLFNRGNIQMYLVDERVNAEGAAI